MVKYVKKKFDEHSNLKHHKFSKEFTTLKFSMSPLLSREKFHQITYIFMAKITT